MCLLDIQGGEIVISPTTKAELPDPIQPSILYMEAALPSQLQSLSISKVLVFPDPRLQHNILPPPLTRPVSSSLTDEEHEEECRKRSYPIIPLHLNPMESSKKTIAFHTGSNKQYDCSFCQKKFMRPSSLKIHTYSHTGEKPFNCSFPGCKRRFSVQSNMRRHLRIHSN